jgi:hypothetical protein
MTWSRRGIVAAAVALGCGIAHAADTTVPVKVGIVKPAKLAKFVSKPPSPPPIPMPGSGDDPTGAGGSLRYFDTASGGAGSDLYSLPAAGWKGLGNPVGSKGYKYKGAGAGADPCRVVLIKEKVIKAVCKTTIGLVPPFVGNAGIILAVGTQRYCGLLPSATAIKNEEGLFKAKDAPPPGSCPTPPAAPSCCGAEQIVTTSTPGTLVVSTLPAFPFPSGVVTRMNAGLPNATCRHDVIIPSGGFSVPVFCIPALGFTSDVIVTGCTGGSADGRGVLWDANAPTAGAGCADTEVVKVGDTSAPPCATLGAGCNVNPGGAGADAVGDVDTTRGNGTCEGTARVHVMLDIPGQSITWNDADLGCPDADGVFDPNTDTLVSQFNFILSPTTGTATASFVDKNGDACAKAGNGPTGPVSLTGTPATGPCCVTGQSTTVVAVGVAFSGGSPLYDLLFRSTTPSSVTQCNAFPGAGSCTLNTLGGCLD